MTGTARLAAAVALLLLGSISPAVAHPAPFSYLDIVFRNGSIEGTLVVHILDIAHDLDITPDRLLDNATLEQQRERIGALLTPRLSLKGRPAAGALVGEPGTAARRAGGTPQIPHTQRAARVARPSTRTCSRTTRCTRRSSTSTKTPNSASS